MALATALCRESLARSVKRIDAIFDIEREINGVTAEERLAARRSRSAPLVAALEEWTRSGVAPT